MATLGFQTNIHPATSARGFGVYALALGGVLFCFVASQVEQPKLFALPLFLGIGMLFGAFATHFNYQNFELHPDGQRYRYFASLLGMNFGEWQPLQPVKGVLLKHFSETPLAGRRGWQVQHPLAYCIVMLSTEATNHQGIIVHKFSHHQRDQAVQLTAQLAAYFGVAPQFFEPQ